MILRRCRARRLPSGGGLVRRQRTVETCFPSSCLHPLSGPVAALQNATNLATLKKASIYHVEVLKVRSTLMGLGMELIWFKTRLACKEPWVRSSILYKLSVVGDGCNLGCQGRRVIH